MRYINEISKDQLEKLESVKDPPKKSKYHSAKTIRDGILFDSEKEADRYSELVMLEHAGAISGLQRQVKYLLIPSQKNPETGRVIERGCSYIADFVYTNNRTGETIVEDAKGIRTQAYKIKKKLMLYKYGIHITEV
ncbi:MAG: DUF1064 domain-containing protein [Roseburia faecis]|nr:DUF1064 domain-containing protein [Roseburia faecis]